MDVGPDYIDSQNVDHMKTDNVFKDFWRTGAK